MRQYDRVAAPGAFRFHARTGESAAYWNQLRETEFSREYFAFIQRGVPLQRQDVLERRAGSAQFQPSRPFHRKLRPVPSGSEQSRQGAPEVESAEACPIHCSNFASPDNSKFSSHDVLILSNLLLKDLRGLSIIDIVEMVAFCGGFWISITKGDPSNHQNPEDKGNSNRWQEDN